MIKTFVFGEVPKPVFKEKKHGDGRYVMFGENNDYPEYLLGLFNGSAKHNAILKGKANYIYGNGFQNAAQINNDGETHNDLLQKLAFDLALYGGFYVHCIKNAIGQKQYYHIDFHKVRSNKENSIFFVKEDWKDKKEEPRTIPAYGADGNEVILMYKEYRPGLGVYPLPDYYGCLNYLESDVEVSKHVLNNASNGFTPSKLINFNNGQPENDEKRAIERALELKFGGSGGKKWMVSFNDTPDKAPSILDLGASDLSKENFSPVNELIQQEIYAGHNITSPSLFGIKTAGDLGGSNELKEAYEIFKNTWVNDKQVQLEKAFKFLFGGEWKIQATDPIGFVLSENALLQVAPPSWLLEKLGIDKTKYPDSPTGDSQGSGVNEAVKSLTGRQHQQVLRIIKQYGQGKITKAVATTLLRNGLGLSDEDINFMLGEDQQFSDDDDAAVFEGFGEARDEFTIVKSRQVFFASNEEMFKDELQVIESFRDLTTLEEKILGLIRDDKRLTPEVIAKVLKVKKAEVDTAIGYLEEQDILRSKIVKIGGDEQVERSIVKENLPDFETPLKNKIQIRYSYEGPQDDRNRPFCAKLLKLDRLYSRADIEQISQLVGYSVWERRGGWYTEKDGSRRPYCRHSWRSNVVIKKR